MKPWYSVLEPDFDQAKKFSDFIGMIVRMAFCQGISRSIGEYQASPEISSVQYQIGTASYFLFLIFSIHLGICVARVAAEYLVGIAELVAWRPLKIVAIGFAVVLSAGIWFSSHMAVAVILIGK